MRRHVGQVLRGQFAHGADEAGRIAREIKRHAIRLAFAPTGKRVVNRHDHHGEPEQTERQQWERPKIAHSDKPKMMKPAP